MKNITKARHKKRKHLSMFDDNQTWVDFNDVLELMDETENILRRLQNVSRTMKMAYKDFEKLQDAVITESEIEE